MWQVLTTRKPLWSDTSPVDVTSQWHDDWKSASVVTSFLVDDPTITQPGFDLRRPQWSLLNRVHAAQKGKGKGTYSSS